MSSHDAFKFKLDSKDTKCINMTCAYKFVFNSNSHTSAMITIISKEIDLSKFHRFLMLSNENETTNYK